MPTARAATSPWAAGKGWAARLVAGAPRGDDLPVGFEVRLDPGTITYWRDPGEAGVAPRFDTAGSTNVAAATVDYPAPQRLDEDGSEAFGYAGSVLFPIHVRRADPSRPATLALAVDYAVCARLCLPARARLRLDLDGSAPPADEAALVDAALASVPRRAAPGDPALPAVDEVAPDGAGLLVRARAGSSSALFAEGADGWYFDVKPARPDGPGRVAFPVEILQKPEGASVGGQRLTLTLVDGDRAVEVGASVDTAAPAR